MIKPTNQQLKTRLKELSPEIVKIVEKGTLFGSIIFGGYVEGESDIDVIVDYDEIVDYINNDHGQMFHHDGSRCKLDEANNNIISVRCWHDNTIYNLVIMRPDDAKCYKFATQTIIDMGFDPVVRKALANKPYRVQLFESLRAFYKRGMDVDKKPMLVDYIIDVPW